jgi:tetratricopeptide (TPR) repeat protein
MEMPPACRAGLEAYQKKDFAGAERSLKQCLELRPDLLTAHLQLCGIYQNQGRDEDLYQIASNAIKRFPEEKRFYLAVGYLAGRKGDYDETIEVLSEAFRRWPGDPAVREPLSRAHFERGLASLDQGEHPSAETDLRKVLELSPDHFEAMLNLGRALHNLEQSTEALQLFDRVFIRSPRTPLVQFHRGIVLYDMGDYDAAVAALDLEIQSNTSYPPSYLFRGLALAHKGEWEKALADLTVASRQMPESAEAAYSSGRCLHRLGRKAEAETAFRRSIELNPSDPRVYTSLGRLLLERGRLEEGREMLQRGRELHAQNRETRPGEVLYEGIKPSRKP